MRPVEKGILLDYHAPEDRSDVHKLVNMTHDAEKDRGDCRLSDAFNIALTASRTIDYRTDDTIFVPTDLIHTILETAELNVRAHPEYAGRATYSLDFQRRLGDFLAKDAVAIG